MALGPHKVVGTPIARPPEDATTQSYAPAVAHGIAVTARHFFENLKETVLGQRNDPVLESIGDGVNTIRYPEQRRPYPARFRGVHRLTTRDDGTVRCVACLCCSTACPAQCIYIVPGEYSEADERRGYERFPKQFVIDELRCVFCGFCVEACPCDAIRMDTGMHVPPYDSRDQFIFDKEQLLAFPGRDGTHVCQDPRREAGHRLYPGITREEGG